MPSVLVTGGAGYVGSHACKALAAAGFTPVAFDNLSQGHRRAVRWGPLEVGDITDARALRQAAQRHGCRAMLHFAAHAYVGESMAAPAKYFRNNAAGSLSVLEAATDLGLDAVVLSSSCAVYGIPDHLPVTEAQPSHPANPYGESKRQMERMAGWFGSVHGLRWMALRYFNAAGADPDGEIGEDHEPEPHLIPRAITAATDGVPLAINGTDYPTADGTAVRDYVHVTDLADAHVLALRHLLRGGECDALNLGSGTGHSVRAVIDTVERVVGRRVAVRAMPRRPGDPPALVADATLARERLGWRPRHSQLATIVETAWRWRRDRIGPILDERGARC
jgi:UDP-arabinose 4-epimerase